MKKNHHHLLVAVELERIRKSVGCATTAFWEVESVAELGLHISALDKSKCLKSLGTTESDGGLPFAVSESVKWLPDPI